ncbi:MAG: hypothetical protein Q9186_004288 [Xanthomendoza sp. 1 TL-2023]
MNVVADMVPERCQQIALHISAHFDDHAAHPSCYSEDVSLKLKSLEFNTLMTDCSAQRLATPTGAVMRNKPKRAYLIWYEFNYTEEHIFKVSPNDTQ